MAGNSRPRQPARSGPGRGLPRCMPFYADFTPHHRDRPPPGGTVSWSNRGRAANGGTNSWGALRRKVHRRLPTPNPAAHLVDGLGRSLWPCPGTGSRNSDASTHFPAVVAQATRPRLPAPPSAVEDLLWPTLASTTRLPASKSPRLARQRSAHPSSRPGKRCVPPATGRTTRPRPNARPSSPAASPTPPVPSGVTCGRPSAAVRGCSRGPAR
jgi:hypothetical protein